MDSTLATLRRVVSSGRVQKPNCLAATRLQKVQNITNRALCFLARQRQDTFSTSVPCRHQRVLMEDLSCMSGQVLDAWQRMLAVMPRNLEEVSEWLNASFATLRKRYFV